METYPDSNATDLTREDIPRYALALPPAVLNEPEAARYVHSRKILFDLIARGFLTPLTTGRRNLTFHRPDLDTALICASKAGPSWQGGLPKKFTSTDAAMAYYKEKKK